MLRFFLNTDFSPARFYIAVFDTRERSSCTLGLYARIFEHGEPARRAAKRSQVSAASISDSMASTALIELRKKVDLPASEVVSISDQLVVAADLKPRKFRTKWQRAVYDGPTARKDAEFAERERWVQLLATLLRSTDTPMGRLIRENPSGAQLLGGGRRAGTLRSRVRTIQKIHWMAHCRAPDQLPEPLETTYRVPSSQVLGALRSWSSQACPLIVHLLVGGGWDGGQVV